MTQVWENEHGDMIVYDCNHVASAFHAVIAYMYEQYWNEGMGIPEMLPFITDTTNYRQHKVISGVPSEGDYLTFVKESDPGYSEAVSVFIIS